MNDRITAICLGPLHPEGRELPASAFLPTPDRPNHLSEFCEECTEIIERKRIVDETAGRVRVKVCKTCNREKPLDQFAPYSRHCIQCAPGGKAAPKGKPRAKRPRKTAAPTKTPSAADNDHAKVLDLLILTGAVTLQQVDAARHFIRTMGRKA